MTAIPSGPPVLAERTDIHRSCKAIDSLLNVLDDYSQVVSAIATLEKKLAKAMRDLGSLKITADTAANAFNSSANLFDSLADISTKFAKITHKEYDGVGGEVRKWFKKLAREEKAHDERLLSANARIKQASQAYEKKSRKTSREIAEEHARYINLISTLGPEISKDKYDHGVSITRQHILTTYSVAACLARIADAEWVRVCESLRRFSPYIGPLGEWRALCEGVWERPLPYALPNIGATEADPTNLDTRQYTVTGSPKQDSNEQIPEQRGGSNGTQSSYVDLGNNLRTSPHQDTNSPSAYARGSPTHTFISTSSGQGPNNRSTDSSPLQPPRLLVDSNTGSVRSLSAFPVPPTHFPMPPPRSATFQLVPSGLNPTISVPVSLPQDDAETSIITTQETPDTDQVTRSESPEQSPEFTTSDSYATKAMEPGITGGSGSNSYVAAMRHRYTNSSGTVSPPPKDMPRLPTSVADLATRYQPPELVPSPSRSKVSPVLFRPQNNNNTVLTDQTDPSSYAKGRGATSGKEAATSEKERHEQLDKEHQLLQLERELEVKAREIEREREELVRARRDIAKQSSVSSGLSALAQQLLPRSRDRKTSVHRQQQLEVPFPTNQADTVESPSSPTQRSYHSAYSTSQPEPASVSPSSSFQQGHHLHSQQSLPSISHHAQGTNQTHSPNVITPSPRTKYHVSGAEVSSRSAIQAGILTKGQHPPYCGCEGCANKYSEPPDPAPSPHALRPPEQPVSLRSSSSGSGGDGGNGNKRTEKSKGGWMRRLSMPVVMGHALNLDPSSKKSHRESSGNSMYTLGAGIGHTPSQSKGGIFSFDGKRNASATNLRFASSAGISVREDGKLTGRRSYEANMAVNQSSTNISLSGKR